VLKAEVSHASEQVAQALQLPERTLVMSLERIRLAAAPRPVLRDRALTHITARFPS